MVVDDLLDSLDELLEKAWSMPGGRCVIDSQKMRDIIDDLRLNMPKELRQAKAIVADRVEIIKNAKDEAEHIMKTAEDKARVLTAQDEITRQAQEKSNEILNDSAHKSREIKLAAADFADNILKSSEEAVAAALTEIKQVRTALKAPAKI